MNIKEKLQNEEPATNGMVKTATIVLGLHKDSTVVRVGVTPAEVQLLIIMHAQNFGGQPVIDITETAPVERSRNAEIGRLRVMYGTAAVRALYGPNSVLPATFTDAIESGLAWAIERGPTEETPLVGRKLTAAEADAFK